MPLDWASFWSGFTVAGLLMAACQLLAIYLARRP